MRKIIATLRVFLPRIEVKLNIMGELLRFDKRLTDPGVELRPEVIAEIKKVRQNLDLILRELWWWEGTAYVMAEQVDQLRVLVLGKSRDRFTPRQLHKIEFACGELINQFQSILCLEERWYRAMGRL